MFAISNTRFAGKPMVTLVVEFVAGVISKVYSVPEIVKKLEVVPPVTTKSANVSPVTASEKVVVTVNRPVCGVVGAGLKLAVGAMVSTAIIACVAAVLPFPAASVALSAGKSIITFAVELAVGVISKVYVVPEVATKLDVEPPVMTKSARATPVMLSEKVAVTAKTPV